MAAAMPHWARFDVRPQISLHHIGAPSSIHHDCHELTARHVNSLILVTAWHYHMLPAQAKNISTTLRPAANSTPDRPLYTTKTLHHPLPPFAATQYCLYPLQQDANT